MFGKSPVGITVLAAIVGALSLTAQAPPPPGTPVPPAAVAPGSYAPPPYQNTEWAAIHVLNCVVQTRGRIGLETGGIEIVYENLGPVAAKQITFGVLYRGQPALIKDAGNFSRGATIDHTFTNFFYGLNYAGPTPEICRVRQVTFADGTVSTAPPLQVEPVLY